MSEYWKNHYDSKVRKFWESPLRQVERTVNGQEMDQAQIDLAVEAIVQKLKLNVSDGVVDLCCGNGLITRLMAGKARNIRAVDISELMIDYAKEFSMAGNIEYQASDVSKLSADFFEGFNKAYICDSISCLSQDDLARLLCSIHGATSVQAVFVSSIPDRDKLSAYYDTKEKMEFYRKQVASGTPHIGNWWTREEFGQLVESQNFKCTILPQNPARMSAYYRFDCLIERP